MSLVTNDRTKTGRPGRDAGSKHRGRHSFVSQICSLAVPAALNLTLLLSVVGTVSIFQALVRSRGSFLMGMARGCPARQTGKTERYKGRDVASGNTRPKLV